MNYIENLFAISDQQCRPHLVLSVDVSPSMNEDGPHHLTVSLSTSPIQYSLVLLQNRTLSHTV